MCAQRMMLSTWQKILFVLNFAAGGSAENAWDDFDLSGILDQASDKSHSFADQSWKLNNAQIFVILIIFFIVVFLTILCCAGRRKRKATAEPSPRLQSHWPVQCHSCQSTIHSASQLTVREDPYPPTYDSIYSTAQSRAMFLHHDQNRHAGPPPSAPPVSDVP